MGVGVCVCVCVVFFWLLFLFLFLPLQTKSTFTFKIHTITQQNYTQMYIQETENLLYFPYFEWPIYTATQLTRFAFGAPPASR